MLPLIVEQFKAIIRMKNVKKRSGSFMVVICLRSVGIWNMDCFQLNHDVIFSFRDREWKQVLVPSNPCRPMISRSHQLYSTKQEHLKKTHAVIVNHVLQMTNPKCFMGNNARIYHMSILQCRFPKSTTGELMKQYRILEQLSSIILILRSVEILFVK